MNPPLTGKLQWSQSSGSNVIPRRARPGLAGLGFDIYMKPPLTGKLQAKASERECCFTGRRSFSACASCKPFGVRLLVSHAVSINQF